MLSHVGRRRPRLEVGATLWQRRGDSPPAREARLFTDRAKAEVASLSHRASVIEANPVVRNDKAVPIVDSCEPTIDDGVTTREQRRP